MKYRLHPEAKRDLKEAASFYRERAGSALALAFLAEFERSVALLLRHPALGAPWRDDKRFLVLQRFPYSLVYTASGDEIRILAVAHHSRRPDYWRRR